MRQHPPAEPDPPENASAPDVFPDWLPIATGTLLAGAIAFLARPGFLIHPSFGKAVVVTTAWIAVTALAGAAGMALPALLRRRRGPWPPAPPALQAIAGWALIPPLLLLSFRASAWAVLLLALVAAAMSLALRDLNPLPPPESAPAWEPPAELFGELPAYDSRPRQSFLISACGQLALVCLFRRDLLWAAVLLAFATFLLVWKVASSPARRPSKDAARPRASAALSVLLAFIILVSVLVLHPGFGGSLGAGDTAEAASASAQKAASTDKGLGYQGVILFTVPQKEMPVAPSPARDLLRSGKARPLVIPFSGAYWYFQAPRHGPGLHAHLAQGDPLAVSIFSTDYIPLAMQAHQILANPVDVSCCGELVVCVRNGDNRPGRIDVAVLLTDSSLPGKPSLYLGVQPIVSSEADHFFFKRSPIDEDLTFTLPAHARMAKFDHITVLFFPSEERLTLGSKVGIQDFQLLPR